MYSLEQTYLSPETEICFVITGNIFLFLRCSKALEIYDKYLKAGYLQIECGGSVYILSVTKVTAQAL
jgi:hypothetical protein